MSGEEKTAETEWKSLFWFNFDDSPGRNIVVGLTIATFGTGMILMGMDISETSSTGGGVTNAAGEVVALKGGTQAVAGVLRYLVGKIRSCGYEYVLDEEVGAEDGQDEESGEAYIERRVNDAVG